MGLREDAGAAELLGTIGGVIARRTEIFDMKPVLAEDSHEMVALRVITEHGVFRVTVEPE